MQLFLMALTRDNNHLQMHEMGRVAVFMFGAPCTQPMHAPIHRRLTLDALATGTFRSTITSDVMASMNKNFIQAVGSQHVDVIAVFRPFKQPYCHENNASLCSPCKIVRDSHHQRSLTSNTHVCFLYIAMGPT